MGNILKFSEWYNIYENEGINEGVKIFGIDQKYPFKDEKEMNDYLEMIPFNDSSVRSSARLKDPDIQLIDHLKHLNPYFVAQLAIKGMKPEETNITMAKKAMKEALDIVPSNKKPYVKGFNPANQKIDLYLTNYFFPLWKKAYDKFFKK